MLLQQNLDLRIVQGGPDGLKPVKFDALIPFFMVAGSDSTGLLPKNVQKVGGMSRKASKFQFCFAWGHQIGSNRYTGISQNGMAPCTPHCRLRSVYSGGVLEMF